MFEDLDFLYLPSRDVAADVRHYTTGVGAELVFAIERFGTRVAMIRLAAEGPDLLLAEHLEGDQPISVFRVGSLAAAVAELEGRGVTVGERFGFPFGEGVELGNPGPQRVAIYEATELERGRSITGRRDFEV
ncbi:MAG: hypothetical protein QOF76_239 [Solirubrobacteraceae bacterium]|nr:hypothetical protein [Solirubrobacteraceae bacterium]